jgi:hypothetical protein
LHNVALNRWPMIALSVHTEKRYHPQGKRRSSKGGHHA